VLINIASMTGVQPV